MFRPRCFNSVIPHLNEIIKNAAVIRNFSCKSLPWGNLLCQSAWKKKTLPRRVLVVTAVKLTLRQRFWTLSRNASTRNIPCTRSSKDIHSNLAPHACRTWNQSSRQTTKATKTIRHPSDLNNRRNETELSKHIWSLKDANKPFQIKWKVIKNANLTVTITRNVTYVCTKSM